jgi:Protein of unknown function (DUF2971)
MSEGELNEAQRKKLEAFREEILFDHGSDYATEVVNGSLLYHYTSVAGFKGVIDSGKFWFTDMLHLNDPSEYEYARNKIMRGLKSVGGSINESSLTDKNAVVEFLAGVEKYFAKTDVFSGNDFFTASFSDESDDLGQWRAYGDDGQGVVLGLKRDLFYDSSVMPQGWGSFGASVTYGPDPLIDLQTKVIVPAVQVVEWASSIDIDRQYDLFLSNLYRDVIGALLRNCVYAKHPAYRNENEWRFLVPGNSEAAKDQVKFRSRGPQLIPYVELPFNLKESLVSVVVGMAASETSEDAVRKLLVSKGLNPDIVTRSKIPYRPS